MAFVSVNAKFKPLSLEEYLTPALMHQQAYEKYEQGVEDLMTEASKYSQYIPKGSKAYEQQQQYLQQLKDTSNMLYNQGMNVNNNFSTVRALRKQYISDVLPINAAAQKLGTYSEEARKLQSSGLYVYGMPTIDDLIQDPNSTYKTLNPEQLQKIGASRGAADLEDSPIVHAITGKIDPYHNVYSQIQQLDPSLKQAVMEYNYEPFKARLAVMGINENTDPNTYNFAMQQLVDGYIAGAATKRKDNIIDDKEALSNLSVNEHARKSAIDLKNKKAYADYVGGGNGNKAQQNINERISGALPGIKYTYISTDKKEGEQIQAAYINNSSANKKIAENIMTQLNNKNAGSLQYIKTDGTIGKEVSYDDIKSMNKVGFAILSDGKMHAVANVTTNNGSFEIVIPANLIGVHVQNVLDEYNDEFSKAGGYSRWNKTRLENRNLIIKNAQNSPNPNAYINNPQFDNVFNEPTAKAAYILIGGDARNIFQTPGETSKDATN